MRRLARYAAKSFSRNDHDGRLCALRNASRRLAESRRKNGGPRDIFMQGLEAPHLRPWKWTGTESSCGSMADSDAMHEDLIETLASAIARHTARRIPLAVDLWAWIGSSSVASSARMPGQCILIGPGGCVTSARRPTSRFCSSSGESGWGKTRRNSLSALLLSDGVVLAVLSCLLTNEQAELTGRRRRSGRTTG